MSVLKITAAIQDGHFEEIKDGGENFVLTFTTPVIGKNDRETFSGLSNAASTSRWNLQIQRRGEHEDETVIGTVCGFDMQTGRFSFLVPTSRAGETGFPMGAFVVTGKGIVGAVVDAKAQVGEIARRLIEVSAVVPERALAEQSAVEYGAVMIGGMVTTPDGMAYYYRRPAFHPGLMDDVRAGVQAPFFWIDARNKQSTQLAFRLSHILADSRIDPYIAGAIILNAALVTKCEPDDYKEAVLGPMVTMAGDDRIRAIDDAIESMPDIRYKK